LFRIESAVIKGLTKPSKTSLLFTWNVPKGAKVDLKYGPIKNLTFQKDHYLKFSSRDLRNESESFRSFQGSLHQEHIADLSDSKKLRDQLYVKLKEHISHSRIAEIIEERSLNRNARQIEIDFPKTIFQAKQSYIYNENITQVENINNFVQTLTVTDKQIQHLKNASAEQSESTVWIDQRKGRITASNFNRVFTKANPYNVIIK